MCNYGAAAAAASAMWVSFARGMGEKKQRYVHDAFASHLMQVVPGVALRAIAQAKPSSLTKALQSIPPLPAVDASSIKRIPSATLLRVEADVEVAGWVEGCIVGVDAACAVVPLMAAMALARVQFTHCLEQQS